VRCTYINEANLIEKTKIAPNFLLLKISFFACFFLNRISDLNIPHTRYEQKAAVLHFDDDNNYNIVKSNHLKLC